VPFFPQEQFQCGPAALATVLAASGVSVTPEALVPRVYLPARRGSLQTELIATARQFDRIPYVIDPSLETIRAEVRAGRPVLVLQNLGWRSLPRWHYAVVVGTDAATRALILRSGTNARLSMTERRFMAAWDRGGRWGMVALRPGEIPQVPDRARLTSAAASLESLGRLPSARATFRALTRAWPDDPTAWFGLGNTEYGLGERAAAEVAYRRALGLDPAHAAALNNLAQLLGERGCVAEARSLLARARKLADSESVAQAIAATESALPPFEPGVGACEPIATPVPR
jgi:hypothetical protein